MPVKELYVMLNTLGVNYSITQAFDPSEDVQELQGGPDTEHAPKTKLFNNLFIVLNPIVACVNVFWF